jgi:hypothetical protein
VQRHGSTVPTWTRWTTNDWGVSMIRLLCQLFGLRRRQREARDVAIFEAYATAWGYNRKEDGWWMRPDGCARVRFE